MSIHYHFIINEHAASGNAKKNAELILGLAKDSVTYTSHYSEYPGHILTIIQQLKPQLRPFDASFHTDNPEEEIPLLVVIGGDGTLHEVMNALYPDGLKIPVAYIPSGSGNDFSRGVGISRNPRTAWQQILQATTPKTIQLLQYQEGITGKSGVVVNNLGIGLDASIVNATNDSASKSTLNKFHLGNLAYTLSIVEQLFRQKGFPITVHANGHEDGFNKAYLCTITNHPYFGGGIKIAPMADAYEKNLDLAMIEKVNPFSIIWLIILLIQQKHTRHRLFHHYKTENLRLVSTIPQYAQLDGEIWSKQSYDFTFNVTEGLFWF